MSRPASALPGFSLQLERGNGRLVLTDRPVGLLVVEVLALSLREVPGRLDLRVGADRFRHQRTRLDKLSVAVDEESLGRALTDAARGTPIGDLEVRVTEGDVVVAGALDPGGSRPPVPFLCRLRPVPAGIAGERVLLISAYETRIFGPSSFSAPALAHHILGLLGLGRWLRGPTLAAVDPIDLLALEICASLGWKAPDRTEVRLESVQCDGGRLSLMAGRSTSHLAPGPRAVGSNTESAFRERRFLEHYEACSLFAHLEARIAEGQADEAIRGLRRQLEVHPGHGFLVGRLIQLQSALPEAAVEVRTLAGARLARFPDDVEALLGLATVRAREGAHDDAAELFERIGELARRRGDELEGAQAAWAAASARAIHQPRVAIAAYESVLRTHHRLPGILRSLADLYGRVGDQAAALRIQQRLVASAASAVQRRSHQLRLGEMAIAAHQAALARQAFEGILVEQPDDIEALDGLAGASVLQGEHLAAVQSLDRAARLLRGRGDESGAAVRITRLGDLWASLPDGAATAHLRYRQALLLAPHHGPALLGLAELARGEGDRAAARGRYEDILRLVGADIDRAEVHLRLGRLLVQPPVEEAGLAAGHLQKALDGTPAQVDAALDLLEALHRSAERYDDLARVLERAVERSTQPVERSDRLLRLAEVQIAHLGDRRQAALVLQEAARLDPENPNIPERLAQLHRQEGDHAQLANVLQTLAERVNDPDRLCAIYLERGDLLRLHLNRAGDAAVAYGLAVGCRPTSRDALVGLSEVYRGQDRPAELAEVLARLARLEAPRDAALVWLELARLQTDVLGRPEAAMASLESTLGGLPDEPEALRRLGDLHFDAGAFEPAVDRYVRLVALYAEEGFDEPAAPFLRRLAAAQEATGRVEDALSSLEWAVREAPDDVASAEQAQDLLLKSGSLDRVARFFTDNLVRARRPLARGFLARRAGRILWRELRRPAEAAPLLDEALRIDPDDADVQRIRLEVATALGEWERVAELLRAQIEGAPAARRPGLIVRLAQVLGGELGRRDEGRALLEEVLQERTGFEAALALLKTWGAEVAVEAVEPPPAPIAAHTVATSAQPEPIEIVDEFVVDRAESVVEEAHPPLGAPPPILAHPVVAGAPLPVLAGPDSVVPVSVPAVSRSAPSLAPAVAELPELSAESLISVDESGEGTADAGLEGSDRLASLGIEARPALLPPPHRVVDPPTSPVPPPFAEGEPVRPAEREPTRLAERVVGGIDDDELGAALLMRQAAVSQANTPAAQAQALFLLAEFRRDAMHDPDAAIPVLEQALDVAPEGGGTWTEALEALEDLYNLRGAWDGLLSLYDRRGAAGLLQPSDRAVLRAATLRAAGQWDEALEEARLALPDERAVELEIELLLALHREGEAVECLLRDLEAQSPEAAALRQDQAAALLSTTQPDRAGALLRLAHGADPTPARLAALLNFARTHGLLAVLADALVLQADEVPPGPRTAAKRSMILLEGARELQALADGPAMARRLAEASLKSWPDNMDALLVLDGLLVTLGDDAALVPVIQQQVGSAMPGPWRDELAARLERLVSPPTPEVPPPAAAEKERKASTRRRSGLRRLAELVPDAPPSAPVEAPPARVEPAHLVAVPAPLPIEDQGVVTNVPPTRPPAVSAAAVAVAVTAAVAADPVESLEVSQPEPVADPTPEHQPNPEGVPEPEAALEFEYPLDRGPLRPLHQVPADPALARLWRTGDLAGLAEALGLHAEGATGMLRAELWARQGLVLIRRPDSTSEAEMAFRAALAVPEVGLHIQLAAIQGLARARPKGTIPDLFAQLERRLSGAADARTRAGLLALRGMLRLDRHRNLQAARDDFQAAASEVPGAALAAAGLGVVASETGAFRSALAWLQAALHAGPENSVPLAADQEEAAFRHLGRVLGVLGRTHELPAQAAQILDSNAGCLPALAVVDSALGSEGAFIALAERIDAALAVLGPPPAEWLWRRAELLAGPLRRRDEAIQAVDAVLVVDASHRSARRLALALAGEREAWTDYVAHGEALLHLPAEEGTRADPDVLRLAVARVYADLLAQPVEGLVHLRALDARDALPLDAVALYVHAARSAGDPEGLQHALEARVRLEDRPVARLALAEHLLARGLREEARQVVSALDAPGLDAESRRRLAQIRADGQVDFSK